MTEINQGTIVELTQKLVQIPSEAGKEQEISRFIAATLASLGFDQVSEDAYGSVTGIIAGSSPGPTLLMDGHTDTVGVAPGVPWTHDPFGGQVVGDRIYGRGSSDMKGALAAMILAAAAVEKTRIRGRIVMSASVMEEVLEGAALEQVMDKFTPDYVIIGEASDMKIVHGGRGRAEISLETTGRPAHTSSPEDGLSAVDAMLPALQAIQRLRLPDHPFVGQAIITLTDIISEPYPGHSVIPSRCRATFDRRLMPGETREGVLNALRTLPCLPGATLSVEITSGEYLAFTGKPLRRMKWFPAWMLDSAHPLVQAASAGLERLGEPVEYAAYQYCTNAAYSQGVGGVPTIGFGPSTEGIAHTVDEYVQVNDLFRAAQAYKAIIESILA